MQNFLRKHRRAILVFIILVIGVPFVLMVPGFDRIFGGPYANTMPQVVAQVGDVPVSSAAFLEEYNIFARTRNATPEQLVDDGTVERILERLINQALLHHEIDSRGYKADREYLVEMLKRDEMFKDENGQFDPRRWNQWVKQLQNANWNEIYNQLTHELSHRIYQQIMTASARVVDGELRREFEVEHTKIKVRYVAVEPKVDVTDEEVLAHYEANKDRYMTPAERRAQFVAISIKPPEPPIVKELVERARAGEDFAELARTHSQGPNAAEGGSLSWVIETATLPDHLKPLFQMKVGEVSGPIEGPTGIHIFKVEEERVSDLAGKRDVFAREIVIRPQLDPSERELVFKVAQDLASAAKESGDLEAAAKAQGFEVKTTGLYTNESLSIDNVDPADTSLFRGPMSRLQLDEISEVIEARNHLYVAKITEVVAPRQKPFDEVRDQAREDAVLARKLTPEYRAAVEQYSKDILAKAKTLDEIPELFPELGAEIKETDYFSRSDFLIASGVTFEAREALAALEGKKPGEMAGPIADIRLIDHFIELVDRQVPDPATIDRLWEQQRSGILSTAQMQAEMERYEDFMLFLREQAQAKFLVRQDMAAVARLIGYGETREGPADQQSPGIEITPLGTDQPIVLTPEATPETAPEETSEGATESEDAAPVESGTPEDETPPAPEEDAGPAPQPQTP